MKHFSRFLVFTEFSNKGYIIGFYDTLDEATFIAKQVFDTQNPNGSNEYYFESFNKTISYNVHPTVEYITPVCEHFETNGFYSAMVFDTQKANRFSLKDFMFYRANTVYAIPLDKYELDNLVFVKDTILFIAN